MLKRVHAIYAVLLFAAAALLSPSCGEPAPAVHGDIAGLPDSRVYLSRYDGKMHRIDSAESVGGRFRITLPPAAADILYLEFENNPRQNAPLVSDGHDVHVEGNFNYYGGIVVSGTAPNDELRQYRDSISQPSMLLQTIELGIGSYADSTALADSVSYERLLFKRDSTRSVMSSIRRDFVKRHPASIVSAMIAAGEVTPSTPAAKIDSLLGELDTEAQGGNAFIERMRTQRQAAD